MNPYLQHCTQNGSGSGDGTSYRKCKGMIPFLQCSSGMRWHSRIFLMLHADVKKNLQQRHMELQQSHTEPQQCHTEPSYFWVPDFHYHHWHATSKLRPLCFRTTCMESHLNTNHCSIFFHYTHLSSHAVSHEKQRLHKAPTATLACCLYDIEFVFLVF